MLHIRGWPHFRISHGRYREELPRGDPEAVASWRKTDSWAKPQGEISVGLTLPMQRVINARFALSSREQGLIVSSSFEGLYRV
jgi:hypothetical protein